MMILTCCPTLSVGVYRDHGAALPHDLLDRDEKTLQWILKSGKNAGPDDVVDGLPSPPNAVEKTPCLGDVSDGNGSPFNAVVHTPHMDDVLVDDSHVLTGQDSNGSQSPFRHAQPTHSQHMQLPIDSPDDACSDVPSCVVTDSVGPVIYTQPKPVLPDMTMSRAGRTIKPPRNL